MLINESQMMDISTLIRSALQHYQKGDLEKAKYLCEKVLNKQPENADILYLLGIIYAQHANYDSAIFFIQKSLNLDTKNADAHFTLGIAFQQKERIDEAVSSFQKTIELNPNILEAYYYLANIFQLKGQTDEAIKYYKKAETLDPGNIQLRIQLGRLLCEKGRYDEAILSYEKALELDPGLLDAYNGIGNAFLEKKDFTGAIGYYQEAIRIDSSNPTAYINLGIAFQNNKQHDEAIKYFEAALKINQNLYQAYDYMGLSLAIESKFEKAMECYKSALLINPKSEMTLINVGNILAKEGKLDEAEEYYRRALEINPDNFNTYEAIICLKLYNSRYDVQASFSECLQAVKKFAEPLSHYIAPHLNERAASRKLRIGYVSPDFRRHSVVYFIQPVLEAHNRDLFEVFCYSNSDIFDEITQRIIEISDHWTNIYSLSDEIAAELIQKDSIDILIDLAGHTVNNRLLLFGRKLAPVQVTWVGYPATTGLSAIDYKIVDHYTDPIGITEQFYSEKLMRLPESSMCYLPDKESPVIGHLPAFTTGHITFGSFNNFQKVTPETIDLWAKILNSIPSACLMLKSNIFSDKKTCGYVIYMFEKQGVPAERIVLLPYEPSTKGHLNTYNRIDIALDTFPYNGTTTTCEALWMGVPVITLSGNTHASRVGTSLLSNVGLPELIAETPDDYVDIAVGLSNDLKKLKSLRESLREMMSWSPLTDARRFTLNLESCYRSMWEEWCNSDAID